VHVHLAGVGTQGSGCWLSPRTRGRAVFRFLRWRAGITERQLETSFDQDWAARIASLVRGSSLDRAVVLGFDGVYDAGGRFVEGESQMVVPPSWVFEVCRRHPGELLPGPSVNPFRRDAMERLEECIEGGAALIKWLPATQAIDPASPRLGGFYRRLAEAGIPLLVHAGGGERTFREVAPELKSVERLRAPLEAGVPVICAHSGTRVVLSRDPDELPLVRAMLREYPHFWVDDSGLANPSRFPHMPRLAADELIASRTLHGSDFPVPASALYYVGRLGPGAAWRLDRERNPLERNVRIKRALGYPEETLTRARGVLANLHRWIETP
jgi:predicted TIM-barrel fold metal-dependent hydrolase